MRRGENPFCVAHHQSPKDPRRWNAWLFFICGLVALGADTPEPKQALPLAPGTVGNLPVVLLEVRQPVQSEIKVPCRVRLLLPAGEGQETAATGNIRIHGASSQSYPKKSFAFTLDTPVRWLGLRRGAHWVLNAAFIDRSLMRHKLSYDLFLSLATTNAPRYASASRFVEVMLNGKYQGAYLLMERVDGALFQFRPYDSNAVQHACVYKAIDHGAHFYSPGHAGYEQREPDPLLKSYWGPLDQLNAFVSSSDRTKFFHPTRGIASQVDLANVIDFHLLVLLTCNMDGFDKNLFLSRDAPVPGAAPPLFFFAPWDYDATFGRNWEGSRVGGQRWLSNNLFDRLLASPDYAKLFSARWKQLRSAQFSAEHIDRLIDDNVAALGDAADRNAARWRTSAGYYPDRLTLREDIAQMKSWVERRTKWLDAEIARRTGF